MLHNISVGRDIKLKLSDISLVAKSNVKISIDENSVGPIVASREFLEKEVKKRMPIYGVTTQFGSEVRYLDENINSHHSADYQESLEARQANLINSHNIGVGPELPLTVSRAAVLLRAHSLAQGYSGVSPDTIGGLLALINNDITPIIRRYGSIGASGDLVPLSAIAATLIGTHDEVNYSGKIMSSSAALSEAGLERVSIQAKEGLALINGTSLMTAAASVYLTELENIFKHLLKSIAMSLEAVKAIDSAYSSIVHELKNHDGQIDVNKFLNNFWDGSKLITSLSEHQKEAARSKPGQNGEYTDRFKLQDYYSIRSVPQGFGTFNESLKIAKKWVEEEANSVNDNPIIDSENKQIISASNFMGYYITQACDMMKTEIALASSWTHAILANLIHVRKNFGLPANLVSHPEIVNGFRPIQILAASLAVQNRKLAQSQHSFMLPTEGDNQDVNSLGTHSAIDLMDSVENLKTLVAILYLAAAQGIDLRGRDEASQSSRKIIETIREVSPFIENDRDYSNDIAKIKQLMDEQAI